LNVSVTSSNKVLFAVKIGATSMYLKQFEPIIRNIESSRSLSELSRQTLLAMALIWGSFILLVATNCFSYGMLVTKENYSFHQSFQWAFSFWWKWAILSPMILPQINQVRGKLLPIKMLLALLPKAIQFSLGAIALSILAMIMLGHYTNFEQLFVIVGKKLFSDFYFGLLIYAAILITGCLIIWSRQLRETDDKQTLQQTPQQSYIQHLMAAKGNSKVLVAVKDISHITAAGNYLELHTEDGQYLLRQTMKGMQQQLDPGAFVRIHRSTLVAVDQIQSISNRACGDYLVTLKSGTKLVNSKSYRNALKSLVKPPQAA